MVWLGAVISLQYVGVFLGGPFFGRLCDYYGPKKVMQLVIAADVILFFCTGLAPNIYAMVAIRFLAGFFTPMPVGTAWIGICVPDDEKAKAFHANTMCLLSGFMIGSAVGGVTADLFLACATTSGIAFLVLILISCGAKPTPPATAAGGGMVKPEGVWNVVKTKEFQAAAFISYNTGQEGAACGPVLGYLYAAAKPGGFGYSERATGYIFTGIVFGLLLVNVCLMDRLSKMAHRRSPHWG